MPMELSLELMTVVGSNFPYAEWELVDDVIDKVDRVSLGMFFIDFKCTNAGGIVNGRILEAAYFLALLSDESQELDVHPDMVTRDLFVITFCMDFAQARSAREPVHPVALEYPVYCCVGQFNAVIARKIPHDPFWPEMVLAPQMQNLLGHLGRCLVGRVFRDGFGIDQTSFTALLIGTLPSVEAGPPNAKIAASLGHMALPLCVLQHP